MGDERWWSSLGVLAKEEAGSRALTNVRPVTP
jgi:hypothetical protein